jgi:hypothetical protein
MADGLTAPVESPHPEAVGPDLDGPDLDGGPGDDEPVLSELTQEVADPVPLKPTLVTRGNGSTPAGSTFVARAPVRTEALRQEPVPQVLPTPQVPQPPRPGPGWVSPNGSVAPPTSQFAAPYPVIPTARIHPTPRITSGPPGRAVSGPPSRIAAAAASLSLPGAADRTRSPAAARSDSANAPWRLKGMIAFIAIVVLTLTLGLAGYLWALPVYDETHSTLVTQDNLIGLQKVTDPSVAKRLDFLPAGLRDLGIANPLTVAYRASDDPGHLVVFTGAAQPVWFGVGNHLDKLFTRLATDPSVLIAQVAAADPGPPGGVGKCGEARNSATPGAICGWQDHGTIALLYFGDRTPQEGAVLMRAIRPALQHRTG